MTKTYGIDYVEFASELSITPGNFRQWTSGRNFPSQPMLKPLCSGLERKVNDNSSPRKNAEIAKLINSTMQNNVSMENIDNIGEFVVAKLMTCYTKGRNPNRLSIEKDLKESQIIDKATSQNKQLYEPTGKTQVVVFDFDGTLTSKNFKRTTWEFILEETRVSHRGMYKITRKV